MKSNNAVLEAYARADEEQRLYLFLSHRDYRLEFMEIDAAGERDGKAEAGNSRASLRRGASFRRAVSCCWGWFG